jgi:hypothetical protein
MKKVKRSKRHMTRGDIEMVNEEVSPKMKDEDVVEVSRGTERNNKLRSDSGNIEFEDTLTSFLYILMRDHVPAGVVEGLARDVANEGSMISTYSNGFLAQYANNLANYLKNAKTNALAKALETAFTGTPTPVKDKPPKMFSIDEGDALEKLKEKVDVAVDNMTDEDKKEWDKRMGKTLEELKKEELERLTKKVEAKLENEAEDDEPKNKGTFVRPDDTSLENNEARQELTEQNVEPAKPESNSRSDIAGCFEVLDKLKKLVPTDSVEQIVKILKSEVEEELTEDAKEEIQTRESILEKRAEENAEHKSSEEGAEEKAIEYIKEEIEKQAGEMASNFDEDGNMTSRGNLKDVREGRAFPEALDKVFEDDTPVDKETVKKVGDALFDEDGPRPHPGVFQRVE